MSERGEALGVGPTACPFVALELDRDRRADKPDYRHRCFAEPTPQPRAISHQAAYCLSPKFAGCPIFQDWAVRASAQPVASAGEAAATAGEAPADAGVAAAWVAAAGAGVAAAGAGVAGAVTPDSPPELPEPGEAWPADAFAPVEEPEAAEQLSVFSAPSAAEQPIPDVAPRYSEPAPSPYYSPEPAPQPQVDDAPVPGFLAGRPERPARSSRPPEFTEKVTREDLIPSWDRDGRFGAEPPERERTDRFGGMVTAIAVIAILGLGVAGVILLPGLLAGGGPARTPTPTLTAAPSGGAVIPTAIVTPVATLMPSPTPDVSAGPTPTPHVYRVRKNDSMAGIARKFHISLSDLLAANPQVTNPNRILPGDLLTIPPAGGSPSAEPSATP